ncbi:MAG TPA: ABC transporter ATP-binding protein [Mycobacteriales bacterium]|nr:ABC transporter ATP-binding protein [Mycobacteriales bacterium]
MSEQDLPGGAIRAQGLGKQFVKYEDAPTLVHGLLRMRHGRRDRLWALNDVDLSIEPGEAVAVMGRNGSGKTTLLSLLCGVTGPSAGKLHVGGRVAPLISIGVGFHPELTGRENVYVNGSILGMTRAQLDRRFDEIVAFSEVEDFIDTPVKFYSSGMNLRLGYAVAAHVDADVLLLDEILAVGDLGFQIKCLKHMRDLRRRGTTIVMVSHNVMQMEVYCERGVVLDGGQRLFDGPVSEAVGLYHELTASASNNDAPRRPGEVPLMSDDLAILDVRAVGPEGSQRVAFDGGETMRLEVDVKASVEILAPFLSIAILSQEGSVVYREHGIWAPYPALAAGETRTLDIEIPLLLTTGEYQVAYWAGRGNPHATSAIDLAADMAQLSVEKRLAFRVRGRRTAYGTTDLQARFGGRVQNADEVDASLKDSD